jgi:hypothetical protein
MLWRMRVRREQRVPPRLWIFSLELADEGKRTGHICRAELSVFNVRIH